MNDNNCGNCGHTKYSHRGGYGYRDGQCLKTVDSSMCECRDFTPAAKLDSPDERHQDDFPADLIDEAKSFYQDNAELLGEKYGIAVLMASFAQWQVDKTIDDFVERVEAEFGGDEAHQVFETMQSVAEEMKRK